MPPEFLERAQPVRTPRGRRRCNHAPRGRQAFRALARCSVNDTRHACRRFDARHVGNPRHHARTAANWECDGQAVRCCADGSSGIRRLHGTRFGRRGPLCAQGAPPSARERLEDHARRPYRRHDRMGWSFARYLDPWPDDFWELTDGPGSTLPAPAPTPDRGTGPAPAAPVVPPTAP